MSNQEHIAVQMDNDNNFIEIQRNRSRSRDRSSTESPGPRKRTTRAVSEIDDNDEEVKTEPTTQNGGIHITPRLSDETDGPRTIMVDGVETQVPDLNAYQHKKTLAQGMMDLALLSANANQLRYVLESYNRHPFFYPSLIFISLSIILQVAVGVGLILNSQYNVKDDREICKANRISNMTIIGIFIITIVNVFISSFGVADAPNTK
ncbi:ninjurin-A-like [Eupeodes corollae]|uniref:ninjurin-A-like n=1 Tax=Eupeodes corollae TaxID=290404 RepID=UPI0024914C78|nr:ninjurin-A-like [Eupeodes corollae]